MLQNMTGNISRLLYKVLKLYGVAITRRTIEQTIHTHPDFPSIRCLSDALDEWRVKHVVMKLTIENLKDLGVPVLAQLKNEEYVWVSRTTENDAYVENVSNRAKKIGLDRFEKEFSGVVLAIEDTTESGEPDFRKKRRLEMKDKCFSYAFAGGFILLLSLLTFFSWLHDDILPLLPKLLLVFVNATGCYISYILIRQEKNQSGRLIQKFCTAGSHIDCNKVTQSPYSKFFGLISLAEAGMACFVSVILWIALAPISSDWCMPLWWCFVATLPLTVWSLFTQAFLIRKWCLFCCVIVLLLWINTGILYFSIPYFGFFPVVESALLALLMLVCTVAVMCVCKTGYISIQPTGKNQLCSGNHC